MLFLYRTQDKLNSWQFAVAVQCLKARYGFAVPLVTEDDVPRVLKTNKLLLNYLHHAAELILRNAIFPKHPKWSDSAVPVLHRHIKVEMFVQKIQFHGFLQHLILRSKNFPADAPLQYASSLFPHRATLLHPANSEKQKVLSCS